MDRERRRRDARRRVARQRLVAGVLAGLIVLARRRRAGPAVGVRLARGLVGGGRGGGIGSLASQAPTPAGRPSRRRGVALAGAGAEAPAPVQTPVDDDVAAPAPATRRSPRRPRPRSRRRPPRPPGRRIQPKTLPERMARMLPGSRQIIAITGTRIGSRSGRLRVYNLTGGHWTKVMDVPGRLRRQGAGRRTQAQGRPPADADGHLVHRVVRLRPAPDAPAGDQDAVPPHPPGLVVE